MHNRMPPLVEMKERFSIALECLNAVDRNHNKDDVSSTNKMDHRLPPQTDMSSLAPSNTTKKTVEITAMRPLVDHQLRVNIIQDGNAVKVNFIYMPRDLGCI
jgi:hypothetical protein